MKSFVMAFFVLLLTFLFIPHRSMALDRVTMKAEYQPLQPAQNNHFGQNSAPRSVFVDLDQDGRLDLVSSSNTTNSIEAFYRNSDGSFAKGVVVFPFNSAYNGYADDIAVGDWNSDGREDLLFSIYMKDVVVLLNKGNRFFESIIVDLPYESPWNYVEAGDVNEDGKLDFVSFVEDHIGVFMGDGKGGFEPGRWKPKAWQEYEKNTNNNAWIMSASLVDMNRDGHLDLSIAAPLEKLSIFPGDGKGNFSGPIIYPDQDSSNFVAIFQSYGDLNHDGYLDAIGTKYYDFPRLLISNRNGEYYDILEATLPAPTYLIPLDINRDGWLDIVGLSNTVGTKAAVLYNRGDGTFQEYEYLYSDQSQPISIHILDLNQDPFPDAAIVQSEPSGAVFLINQGIDTAPPRTQPGIVRVPEEITTLRNAIQTGLNGDVISLAPGTYKDLITIQNKEISIVGREGQERPSLHSYGTFYWAKNSAIQIKDSSCTLSHIKFQGYWGPAIHAFNSNLNIAGCEVIGAITNRTGGYLEYLLTYSQPALHMQNCNRKEIILKGNVIHSGGKSEGNIDEGPAVLIESCTDTIILTNHNRLTGGFGMHYIGRNPGPMPGGNAFAIYGSEVRLISEDDEFTGGNGTEARWVGNSYGQYIGGQPGGKGVAIDHSTVFLQGGNIMGGTGGNGGDFTYYDLYTNTSTPYHFPGAPGGHGIEIRNHSIVEVNGVISQGGQGGDPEGKDGEAYFVDVTSTLRFSTAIDNWSLW